MKIGLVCPYNMYRGGGVQECVLAMRTELTARGHEVSIITPLPREMPNDHAEDGIIFMGAGAQVKSFRTTAQVSATVSIDKLEETLEAEDFDILHFHEPWVPMISRQILPRSKSLNVATFHAKLPDTVMHRTIEKVITPYTKSILKYLDALTAVSDAAADYVTELTDEPITIIPNGIDLSLYKPSEQPVRNKDILYIGRLEKRKGVKYLIKAMERLLEVEPQAHLKIAGDGPDREKLEDYVAYHDLGEHIEFLGFISQEDKLRLLQEARLFCSPALYGESFGIVLLEAMASGTPVVAGNNPGYSGVLAQQSDVSLVDPKETDEFAALLRHMLCDDAAYDDWRAWALKEVRQYDYVKIIDAYEDLYKELIKQNQ